MTPPSAAVAKYLELFEAVSLAVEQGTVTEATVRQAEALELRHQMIPRQERDGLDLEPRSIADQVRRIALRQGMAKSGNTMRYLGVTYREPGMACEECVR